MSCIHLDNKQRIYELSQTQYNFEPENVQVALNHLFSTDAKVQLCYPFETMHGPKSLFEQAILPLSQSIDDLERRDTIIIAGETEQGASWVGACGYYCGTFSKPFLDIPPTGHMVSMRFHEFYKFDKGKVCEFQAIWDIPELMMQANAWPMVPSLGREWHVPGPATLDGISLVEQEKDLTHKALKTVVNMCDALGNYAAGGVKAMQLEKYWHPKCSWYGPSGIGTARKLDGFRNWHQIPFLNGLPDRVGDPHLGHAFADNSYVGFTAWPGMSMTVSGSGWLGIAPGGQKITMRSLDFWRLEGSLIRENWVLIDLLSVYMQLGVDVLARMREFNKARNNQ